MNSPGNSRWLVLAALAGTLLLTACAGHQTRPAPDSELRARASSMPAAPRSALAQPHPAQPRKWNVGLLFPEEVGSSRARTPKQSTLPASGTSSAAPPLVPRVPSFACIPVDNYHAMQKKVSELKSVAAATDKRNRMLEAKLKQQAAERQARRKARQVARAAPPPPRQLKPLLSRKVVDSSGDSLGRIVGVLADATGQVRAAVIELGGFLGVGARKVAVEWSLVDAVPAGQPDAPVKLKVSRKTIDAAPTYTGADAATHELVRAPAPPSSVGATPPAQSRQAAEKGKPHKAAPATPTPNASAKAAAKPKKPQPRKTPKAPAKPAASASVKKAGPAESVPPPSSAASSPASVSP